MGEGEGYNMKTVIWWNDKNLVRVSLLGGFSRWGEGMSKFLAS